MTFLNDEDFELNFDFDAEQIKIENKISKFYDYEEERKDILEELGGVAR